MSELKLRPPKRRGLVHAASAGLKTPALRLSQRHKSNLRQGEAQNYGFRLVAVCHLLLIQKERAADRWIEPPLCAGLKAPALRLSQNQRERKL
jgi:hypothetical protein